MQIVVRSPRLLRLLGFVPIEGQRAFASLSVRGWLDVLRNRAGDFFT